jgi:hypothetical protein
VEQLTHQLEVVVVAVAVEPLYQVRVAEQLEDQVEDQILHLIVLLQVILHL